LKITIYTRPDCQPCKAAKRKMGRAGLVYTEEAATGEHRAAVLALGYMAAPVTVVTYDNGEVSHWYGFRPDLIDSLTDIS
jgi:glutaredoxin-like protein NrdH